MLVFQKTFRTYDMNDPNLYSEKLVSKSRPDIAWSCNMDITMSLCIRFKLNLQVISQREQEKFRQFNELKSIMSLYYEKHSLILKNPFQNNSRFVKPLRSEQLTNFR